MSDLQRWLDGLGLSKYLSVLAQHEIDFEILPELNEEDLEQLGIPLGPRRKLLRAAPELKRGGQRTGAPPWRGQFPLRGVGRAEGEGHLPPHTGLPHRGRERGGQSFEAELHRLRGELLRQGAPDAAEACFRQSLDIARRQEAESWELRAAMSLARLRRDQGKHEQAHELLTPVYEWFSEGFETPDLREARGLLEELAVA